MEITWHKDSCFRIKGKKTAIVINPTKESGKLKGDLVLSSVGENLSEVDGMHKLFDWPGEYESRSIPVNGFVAWTKSKAKESKEKVDETIIFCFQVSGVKFCHLGELGHTLTSDMVNEIGDVDILMIKVGEGTNLDTKKAMEIIEAIQPRVIIPMGTDNPAEALKEVGSDKLEKLEKLEFKSASELPTDQMRYVVLDHVA